ncbi:MAG: NUDIX hydrolase [Woeseiaceae bacterium]
MRSSAHAVPQPSATVLLLRAAAGAPEIFMLLRHARTAFGDVHVFPGGVVDDNDRGLGDRCYPSGWAQVAGRLLGVDDALAWFSAAIRELFEETGVLLARRTSEASTPASGAGGAEQARHRLRDGSLMWRDYLERHGLQLDCERLEYFAYRVTPHTEPRRFATRFFAAVLPAGQSTGHDGVEHTDSCWMTAVSLLEAERTGAIRLIYPTYRTLGDIAGFATVAEVLAWARERQKTGIARVRPAIVEVDGRDRVVLPGDPRYPRGECE